MKLRWQANLIAAQVTLEAVTISDQILLANSPELDHSLSHLWLKLEHVDDEF